MEGSLASLRSSTLYQKLLKKVKGDVEIEIEIKIEILISDFKHRSYTCSRCINQKER